MEPLLKSGEATPREYFEKRARNTRERFEAESQELTRRALTLRRRRRAFCVVLGVLSACMGFFGASTLTIEDGGSAGMRHANVALQLAVAVLGVVAATYGSEARERAFTDATAACDAAVSAVKRLEDNYALLGAGSPAAETEQFVHLALDVLRGAEEFAAGKIPLH